MFSIQPEKPKEASADKHAEPLKQVANSSGTRSSSSAISQEYQRNENAPKSVAIAAKVMQPKLRLIRK
jgi:hypothetical protein